MPCAPLGLTALGLKRLPDQPHEEHRRQTLRVRLLPHQWAHRIDERLWPRGNGSRRFDTFLNVVGARGKGRNEKRNSNGQRRERSRAAKERSAVYGKFLGKSCGSARSKASQTITRDKNPTRVIRPNEGRSAFVNKDITARVDIN